MKKRARKYDETRTVNKFLWFKKVIGNEIRWLAHVQIKQTFSGYYTIGPFLFEHWADIEWVD